MNSADLPQMQGRLPVEEVEEEEVGLVGSPLARASDGQLWSFSGKNGVVANPQREKSARVLCAHQKNKDQKEGAMRGLNNIAWSLINVDVLH